MARSTKTTKRFFYVNVTDGATASMFGLGDSAKELYEKMLTAEWPTYEAALQWLVGETHNEDILGSVEILDSRQYPR